MKKLILYCCASLLLLSGCGEAKPETPEVPQDVFRPVITDIEQIDIPETIEEIYKTVEVKELTNADDQTLEEKFLIKTELLNDYYVRYSSGRYGLADVFFLKPASNDEIQDVREMLQLVKLNRAKEFEDYDIYNARQIALDGQIFEQGGYVILLMLEDMDAARDIIDRYIPQT